MPGEEFRKETVIVVVDGEQIAQEVFVDNQTGLDVDPHSGVFRTRKETTEHIREVYMVGKDSMQSELERYNRWMKGKGGKRDDPLMPKGGPVLKKISTPANENLKSISKTSHPSSSSSSRGLDINAVDTQSQQWKTTANQFFAEKKYHHALLLYSRIEASLGPLLLVYPLGVSGKTSNSPSPSSRSSFSITFSNDNGASQSLSPIPVSTGLTASLFQRIRCETVDELLWRLAEKRNSESGGELTDNLIIGSDKTDDDILFLPITLSHAREVENNKNQTLNCSLLRLFPQSSSLRGISSSNVNTSERRSFLAVCMSNASEAHLRLGRPLEAYRCAKVSMLLDESNLKASYRAAQGALGIGEALLRLSLRSRPDEEHDQKATRKEENCTVSDGTSLGDTGCDIIGSGNRDDTPTCSHASPLSDRNASDPLRLTFSEIERVAAGDFSFIDTAKTVNNANSAAGEVCAAGEWFEKGLSIVSNAVAIMGQGTDSIVVSQMADLETRLIGALEGLTHHE